MLDVIIIGAGAAGIAAARKFRAAGLKFKILEARDRVGGRAHSIIGEFPVELGPEFIHGRAERLTRMLSEMSVNSFDVPDYHHEIKKGRLCETEMWDEIESILKKLPQSRNDLSVGAALKSMKRVSAHSKALTRAFVQGFDAALIDEVSSREIAETASQVSDPQERKVGRTFEGYKVFFERLTQDFGEDLILSAEVNQVQWQKGHVEVTYANPPRRPAGKRSSGSAPLFSSVKQESLSAQSVLLTVPVGVLKSSKGERGHIAFSPALEEKALPLSYLQMGPVVKVMLQFKTDFWSEKCDQPVAMFHAPKEDFQTWWTASPMRWPLLTAWSGGDPAQKLSQLSESEKAEHALSQLARMFGMSKTVLKKNCVRSFSHDWESDAYSRGAYSFVKAGGRDARKLLAKSIASTLYFAGEATSAEQNGTIEGGLESGEREAEKIIRALLHRKTVL